MRLPERKDILDYVENAAGQDTEVQKQILSMLASSRILREQVAELKRDLYLVSSQVPEYVPDATLGPELVRLSQVYLQVVYQRKFSPKEFYRSREFLSLLLMLTGFAFLLLGLLGFSLLRSRS